MAASPSETRDAFWWLGAAALAVGLVLRVTALRADPIHGSWIGWLADEGRWVELGREWVLFGAPELESPISRTHLLLGPLYQAVQALAFAVFGVSTVVARALSVGAGVLILGLVARFLRPRVGTNLALLGVGLLAIHPDLVYFSRVAIPEMPSLALQVVGFCLLVGAPRTRVRAFWAGVAVAAALGFKGTVAPVVPIFSVAVWVTAREADPASPRARWATFFGAIALPALLFFAVLTAVSGSVSTLLSSSGSVGEILVFLQPDTLYGAVSVLHEGEWTLRLNVLLAALWGAGVLLLLRGGTPPSEPATLLAGALTWLVGWIALWSYLEYFPERYVVHLHVPVVFALVAVFAALRDSDGPDLATAMVRVGPGARRWAVATAASVPLAALITPALLAVYGATGGASPGILIHLPSTLLVASALGWVVARSWSPRALVAVGLALPLAGAAAWTAVHLVGALPGFYWEGGGDALPGWVAVMVATPLAGAALVGPRPISWGSARRILLLYTAALVGLWSADQLAQRLQAVHVMDEVRAVMAERYSPDTVVGVARAASIFIDTRHPVRQLFTGGPAPDVIAITEGEVPFYDLPAHRVALEVMVPLGARFYYEDPVWDRIRIYERVTDEPAPPVLRRESP